jgi:hypothetical protein
MATNIELVQQLYVAYFNRPGDVGGVNFYTSVLEANPANYNAIAADFAKSAEYQNQFKDKVAEEIIDIVYMNMFGRHAEKAALDFYGPLIQNHTISIDKVVLDIVKGAQGTDAVAYDAKVDAAAAFTTFLDTAGNETARVAYASGKGDVLQIARDYLIEVKDATTLAAAVAGLAETGAELTGELNEGQTFVLVKGLDNVTGSAGNDLIIGSIDDTAGTELNTLSGIDIINGGSGTDTLKVAHNKGTITVGNLSNVEIVSIDSAAAAGVTINTATVSGLTNLNIVKAAGAIDATAAATTSVDVSMQAVGNVVVKGGKDVNVALTDVTTGTIDVGASGTDPVGNVTITATGKAAANNADSTMGDISVGGGKTVTVTQHVGAADAIVADGTDETFTQGDVSVVASADTTDVTVKQDAFAEEWSVKGVTGTTEVASVKFSALATGETVTVGSLTFTAAKDLTAAQVAQAFANLSSSAVAPTQIAPAATATSDTQGSAIRANGVFTGSLLANWSSAAATDDTVVFTAKANTTMTDLVATAKATVTTTTQGLTAVTAHNDMGVYNGTVTIDGGVALKTVTVDGFAASTGGAGINGATNAALTTINLSNGYDADGGVDFEIDSAAATLALNLENVDGTVTVTAGTKTLNAKVVGDDTVVTLASASTETVNVSGTGKVAGSTAAGLTVATSINTSAMTAGSATFTIADGGVTSYTGGAGTDSVTINNAGTAISKAVDLGAGNDKLTLVGTAVVPTATLKGGAGTDTIAMTGASGAAMSANGDFAGKIDGFEKLSITDTVSAATTVNMANMDGITYVISKNSAAAAAAAVKEVFTVDLSTSGVIAGADTIVFNGTTVTLSGGETTAQIAQKVALASYADWAVTGLNGSVVTFEAKVAEDRTDIVAANFVVTDVDAGTAADSVSTTTQGTNVYTLDLTNLALTNGDTFTIGSYVYTAGGNLTAAQTITAIVAASPITIGGLSYTVTDGAGDTLVLTTTAPTAPASLTYVAAEVGGDGGFVAGTGNNVAAAKANGATEVFAAAFAGSGAIEDGDTIAFDGTTVTLTSGMSAAQIAAAVAAATFTNWNVAVDSGTNTTVNFTAKTAGVKTDGDITVTPVANANTAPKVVVTTTTQGVNMGGATSPALTIDKMANAGTLELVEAGAGVIVKMADATGSADSLNLVTKVNTTSLGFGTVDVAGVETIKFTATDLNTSSSSGGGVNTATVNLKADKASALTIDGSSNVTLTLDAATTKLVTIDATALTGKLNVAANGVNAMTITGGAGADTLSASTGASAKADVINGGAGKDVIYAGSNGAKLTGGDGNDLFIMTSAAAAGGNKESNTYSEITDFKAGDVLQLQAFIDTDDNAGTAGGAVGDVTAFTKLAATLNENTAVFSDFVNAAVKEAVQGAAVWFSFKGDTYVVVDSNVSTDTFVNGDDLIVKLTGINGDNLSWNADYATLALI